MPFSVLPYTEVAGHPESWEVELVAGMKFSGQHSSVLLPSVLRSFLQPSLFCFSLFLVLMIKPRTSYARQGFQHWAKSPGPQVKFSDGSEWVSPIASARLPVFLIFLPPVGWLSCNINLYFILTYFFPKPWSENVWDCTVPSWERTFLRAWEIVLSHIPEKPMAQCRLGMWLSSGNPGFEP